MQNTFRLPVFVTFQQIPAPDKLKDIGTLITLDATMVSSFSATELTVSDPLTQDEIQKVNSGELAIEIILQTKIKRKIGCTQIQMLGYTIYVEEAYNLVKDIITRALANVNKGS